MPTREICVCGGQIELADSVAAPAMTLESWRKSHRHDSAPQDHELPDPEDVKGTLPQVPAGGTYSSHSFGPQHRGVTASNSRSYSRRVDLGWVTP